jgi:carboxyl-terminal processing protease
MRATAVLLALLAAGCVSPEALRERIPWPGTYDQVVSLVEARLYDMTLLDDAWAASVQQHRARWQRATTPDQRAGVLRDLLAGLGVSHTGYYLPGDPAWFELLDLFREGPTREAIPRLFSGGVVRYETLGLVLTELDGGTYVADVLEGTPAFEAGVRVGERLLAAAELERAPRERSTSPPPPGPTRLLLSSDCGGERLVDVTPLRIQPEELYLTAQRASARIFDRDGYRVAYVRLRSWASPRYQELLERQLLDGDLSAADALVLDLRGGWGGADPGYVTLFGGRAPELRMRRRGEPESEAVEPRPEPDRAWTRPVVLLVDGTTRSGKEVVAFAFRSQGLGPVVGERTAGAVLGGRPFVLQDGSLLMLAVADVTVDGERLEGVGVEPDVVVPRDLRADVGGDPQLEAALEEALRPGPGVAP